jgi:hypothetical protein
MAQLPSKSQFGDYGEWPGRDVLDSGGERLGGVREIYLDGETGRPEWVLVEVDGDEPRFVPLADAAIDASAIRVAHSATVIRGGPSIGPEPRIDQSQERRLYKHYRVGYSEDESRSGLPAPGPAPTGRGAPDAPAPGPAPADAPPTASGAPDGHGTNAPDTPPPVQHTSSWSAAAPVDGPTDDAPPPAEPPSLDPESPAAPALPTPPSAAVPDPVDPTPPAPAAAAPRPRPASPPAPVPQEPSGGALAVLKSRRARIACGVGIAALLFLVIRRLR